MSLEKRKATITFLSVDSVMITNMFYQRTFNLTETIVVDLHNLKKLNALNIVEYSQKAKVNSPFFVCFTKVNKNEFNGLVIFKPGKDRIEMLQQEEDIVTLQNNNKTFSATVFIDD